MAAHRRQSLTSGAGVHQPGEEITIAYHGEVLGAVEAAWSAKDIAAHKRRAKASRDQADKHFKCFCELLLSTQSGSSLEATRFDSH